MRLALGGSPAWLVLAESWSKGWHAYCTARGGDERDLGATGADRRLRDRLARARGLRDRALRVPAAAAGQGRVRALGWRRWWLMLACCWRCWRAGQTPRNGSELRPPALGLTRSSDASLGLTPGNRRPTRSSASPGAWRSPPASRSGLAGGFLFALRAGAVLAPLTVLALRAGVSVRRLLLVAAACIGALPLVYLVFPARDRGRQRVRLSQRPGRRPLGRVLAVLCLLGAGLLLAVRLRRASASGSRSST